MYSSFYKISQLSLSVMLHDICNQDKQPHIYCNKIHYSLIRTVSAVLYIHEGMNQELGHVFSRLSLIF